MGPGSLPGFSNKGGKRVRTGEKCEHAQLLALQTEGRDHQLKEAGGFWKLTGKASLSPEHAGGEQSFRPFDFSPVNPTMKLIAPKLKQ